MSLSKRKFPVIEGLENRRLLSGAISGTAYADLTGDGLHGKREPAKANVAVYLDLNDSQTFDTGDVAALTNRKGKYKFGKLARSTFHLRMMTPDGFVSTAPPGGAYFVDLRFRPTATARDFGFWSLANGPAPGGTVTSPGGGSTDPNPPIPLVMYNTGATKANNADGSNSGPLLDGDAPKESYYVVQRVSTGGTKAFAETFATFNTNRITSDLNSTTAGVDSEFVSPTAGSNDVQPADQFLYATAFDLTGLEAVTASISGTVVADDRLVDIRLNGASLGFNGAAGAVVQFSVARGFVPGVNTLEFLVSNDGASTAGIRVDNLRGTARRIIPGPITLFNTGVSDPNLFDGTSTTPLSTGQADPHWFVSTPGKGFDFYVDDAAHQFIYNNGLTNGRFGAPYVANNNANWENGDVSSTHPGVDSAFINPVGDGNFDLLAGNYIYRTTFDLTGLDNNTAVLDGIAYASGPVDVYLNGSKVVHLETGPSGGAGVAFHLSKPIVAGINVLDFVMTTGTTIQPSGLRIEGLRGTAAGGTIRPDGALPLKLPLPPFIPAQKPSGQIPT